MRSLLLVVALLVSLPASAQKPAFTSSRTTAVDCSIGTAEADLDVGGVRARLYNIGGLFYRGSGNVYEVPRESGRHAVYAASLWIGGLVDGDLHFAGSRYGPWEFWPGPLDAVGNTSPEQCAEFDRIWSVTTSDLEAYDETGVATSDLEDWPVAFGAPFYRDLDGDSRQDNNEPTVSLDIEDAGYRTKVLDLEGGERPVIFGRQTAWWVMNDVGGPHDWSEEEPLGVEVRVTAWALAGSESADLTQSTFYRYEIINRSQATIEDAHVGMYVDADVGDPTDDYVGSDSTRSMLFFYNGDDFDNPVAGGYGTPPALGIDILSGAHGAMYHAGGGTITSEPGDGNSAYTYLQSLWKDGTPLRLGDDGYDTNGPVTRWAFGGDPPAFWSMYNSDGNGRAFTATDWRALVSSHRFRLEPREHHIVDIGFLFAQGADNLDSVRELKVISNVAQRAYESGALFDRGELPPAPPTAPVLLSPDNGAVFDDEPVTFSWAPISGTTNYTLEVASEESFEDAAVFKTLGTSVEVPRDSFPNNTLTPTFWRVTGYNLGVAGPTSEVRRLTNPVFFSRVTLIEVVANAAGPIVPPTGGAAGFAGFPVPRTPGAEQQVSDAVWLLDAGGSTGTFESFFSRVVASRSPDNLERIDDYDFEARFTGPSMAYRRFQDLTLVEIPFEIWNIGRGTPDDPSDDFRMVPAILDYTYPDDSSVPNGVYDLSTRDSPVSDEADDPYTDWVYWYEPNDKTPGESGYQAWLANATTAPTDHGGEVLARTVFVGWDLGTGPPYAEPYPEPGTVFRITTLKRFNVADEESPSKPFSLEVYPNPVSSRAEVAFALEAAGVARLAVYDVLGREVTVLEDGLKTVGEHRVGLEVGRLAPGVYVVVLEGANGRASRTVTVVR